MNKIFFIFYFSGRFNSAWTRVTHTVQAFKIVRIRLIKGKKEGTIREVSSEQYRYYEWNVIAKACARSPSRRKFGHGFFTRGPTTRCMKSVGVRQMRS